MNFARSSSILLFTCGLMAAPVHAAIPPAVDAMVREAAKGGDEATLKAVVKVAQATNPDDAEAIGALGASLLAEEKAKAEQARIDDLSSRGFFEGWTGEGQVGLGITSGNTDERSAVAGIKLNREGIKTRHKFSALVDYLSSNGVTTRQKYGVDYAFNYKFSERFYATAGLGWERDIFAGIDRRFVESIGLGYRAIDGDAIELDLEGGPALRQTLYSDAIEENEFAARGSLAFRWAISDGIAFSEDASILYGAGNTTLISTTALTARLNGKLSARMSFNVENESDPPAGREKTDTTTRFTLVYGF